MRKVTGLLFAAFVIAGVAQAQEMTKGTVLSVKESQNYPSTAGSNPSDAPLAPEVFSYEINVRLDCSVLTGRYETEFDYFPSTIAADQTVPVRAGRHNLHFLVPGYGQFKVPIVHRHRDRSSSCSALHATQNVRSTGKTLRSFNSDRLRALTQRSALFQRGLQR